MNGKMQLEMKKTMKFMLAAFAIVAAASCAKEIAPVENETVPAVEEGLVPMTFKADLSSTKAAIDGKTIVWESTDAIAVFDGTAVREFTVTECDGKTATFSGAVLPEATEFYASYPYDANFSVADGVMSVSIPAVQTIPDGKDVAPEALVMAAKVADDYTIQFKNVFSLVKVEVDAEGITAVSFAGAAGEKVTGAVSVAEDGTATCAGTAGATIKPSGTSFAEGEYYIAIAPAEFESGLSVACSASDGSKIVKKSANAASFAQNGGCNLGVVTDGAVLANPIMNKPQLKAFAENADVYVEGDVVELGADIDLEGEEWVPAKTFLGVFDGKGYKVYNIVVTAAPEGSNTGLFSTVGNGSGVAAGVKNLIVGSEDGETYDGVSKFFLNTSVTDSYRYAGVIPYAHVGTTYENIVNFAKVDVASTSKSNHRVGGVTGTCKANVTMKNCVNYGSVEDHQNEAPSSNSTIGGVTGAIDGAGCLITECSNNGMVNNFSPRVCHVAGIVGKTMYKSVISSCRNYAAIKNCAASIGAASGYAVRVGGITAALTDRAGSEIIECENKGLVTQTVTLATYSLGMGGIVGVISADGIVKGCSNEGVVVPTEAATGTGNICGGIVGYVTGCKLTLTASGNGTLNVNKGDLIQKVNYGTTAYAGGIVGYNKVGGCIKDAVNYGAVKGASVQTGKVTLSFGGICGAANDTEFVNDVNNSTGAVLATAGDNSATFNNAGICGAKGTGNSYMYCKNYAEIRSSKGTKESRIGGIVSTFTTGSDVMKYCENYGKIYVSRGTSVRSGGLTAFCNRNASETPVTAFEGCLCDYTSQHSDSAYNSYFGYVVGCFDMNETNTANEIGETHIGSAAEPVKVKLGRIITVTSVADYTITADNYTQYIQGQGESSLANSHLHIFHIDLVD